MVERHDFEAELLALLRKHRLVRERGAFILTQPGLLDRRDVRQRFLLTVRGRVE